MNYLKVVKENEYRSDAMIWLVNILMYLKWLRKCVKQCSNSSNNKMSCRKIFLFMNCRIVHAANESRVGITQKCTIQQLLNQKP